MTRSAAGPPTRRWQADDAHLRRPHLDDPRRQRCPGTHLSVALVVAGKIRYATFKNKALANSHEAKIKTPPCVRAKRSTSPPGSQCP